MFQKNFTEKALDFLQNSLLHEKLEENRSAEPECTQEYMRIRAPNRRTSSLQKQGYARSLLTFLVLIYVGVLFCIALKAFSPFIADDSYITLRYAKHLAEGYGITWNIGQPPLEGYSNFTYLLLASLLYSLQPHFHYEVIDIIRYFSLTSFVATFFIMYRTMRLWVSPTIALLPVALLVSYPSAMLWATSGLEMPFFQLLIASTVYALCTKHFKIAGLCIALASLTRPEGPLFFLVFLGILFFQTRQSFQKKSFFSHPLFLYIITFTAIFLPYFIFRLTYFGRLFPNPVYCKFMNKDAPFALLIEFSLAAIPLLIPSFYAWFKNPREQIYYFIIPSIACFFMLYGVDPIVGVYNRYGIPFLSLLMMSAVLGFSDLSCSLLAKKALNKLPHIFLVIFFVATFIFLFMPYTSFQKIHTTAISYQQRSLMRTELSNWIKKHLSFSQSVLIGDCGLIPLSLNKIEIVDSLCINSAQMTTSPINKSYLRFAEWILYEKKPDYIILNRMSFKGQFTFFSFNQLILSNERFKKHYHLVKTFISQDENYYYEYKIYQKEV